MIFRILFILVLCVSSVSAHAKKVIATKAKQAIMVDFDTGMVLFSKNPDQRMPTSSMSKVMTAYMVFDAIKEGKISLDDTFLVSEKAWKKQGSKMFIEVDKRVRIEDLIRGVIIQSGNDATIALAEGLAGTEEDFAKAMTLKAKEIGMNSSNFRNASGWPDPNHYSTARDLATLCVRLIENFPEYYGYYSEMEFTFNGITQKNRNPLLYRDMGADGVKTGHTNAGGYGVIGSGTHDGRRVILVVNGLQSSRDRAQESAKLLEWGLRGFINKTVFKAGETIESFDLAYGHKASVKVGVEDDLLLSLPKISPETLKIVAEYEGPIVAPLKKGQEVGKLIITVPGRKDPLEKPLVTTEDVPSLGFVSKTFAKAKQFFATQL